MNCSLELNDSFFECVVPGLLTPCAFPEQPVIEFLSRSVRIIIDSIWQMRLPVLTGPPVSITQSDSRCRSSHRRLASFHPKIRFASRCQKSAKSMEVKSHFVQTGVFATPSLILPVIAKDARQYKTAFNLASQKPQYRFFSHFNLAVQLYLRVDIPD